MTNVISHPSAVRCSKGLVPTTQEMPPIFQTLNTNTSVAITEKKVHTANKRRTNRIMSDSSRR
jgi:hypothetical protein